MRLFPLLVLLVVGPAIFRGEPAANSGSSFRLPPLAQQMEARSIAHWGQQIVVETDRSSVDYANEIASPPYFWSLDAVEGTLTRLELDGGRRYLGLSTDSGPRLAVAMNGPDLELLTFGDEFPSSRRLCVLGQIHQPQRFHVATVGQFIAVVGAGQLTVVADGQVVRRFALSDLLPAWWSDWWTQLAASPQVVAATRRELFLGFDFGEFGGGAYAIALTETGDVQNARQVWPEHVSSIAIRGDDAWLAGGLAHMGWIGGSVVHDRLGRLNVLIHQAAIDLRVGQGSTEQPVSAAQPPAYRVPLATSFAGLAIDAEETLIVAATRVGLIGLRTGEALTMLWDGPLSPPREDQGRVYEGNPVGLVSARGRLFVATRFLGVLEFRRLADEFIFHRQIAIPTEEAIGGRTR